MFSLTASVRNLRAFALAAVLALVASISLVVLGAAPSQAAFAPTLTVTPTSATTVRVDGKFPHKTGGKVTALYVMACANPGKNRPSSTYCVSDWKGSKSALTIAPKDADARTKAMFGKVLTTVGTVRNGVWTFSVNLTLPKSIKANGKTVTCGTANKTCGIGTRLSASVSTSSKAADKFAFPSKKASTIAASASGLKSTVAGMLTVSVKTPAVAAPTGTLKVTVAGKTVTKTLTAAAKGKTTIKLPKLKKGKHTVKVTYTPSGAAKFASKTVSKSVTVTVK